MVVIGVYFVRDLLVIIIVLLVSDVCSVLGESLVFFFMIMRLYWFFGLFNILNFFGYWVFLFRICRVLYSGWFVIGIVKWVSRVLVLEYFIVSKIFEVGCWKVYNFISF